MCDKVKTTFIIIKQNYLLNRHHAERDVSRGGFVGAANMIHLVGLREHNVVVLQDNGVCISSRLNV